MQKFKYYSLAVALLFMAFAYCQPSNDSYTLTIEKGKEVKERGKVFWAVPVKLTNSSKSTLKYYSMSCSWQDLYSVDTDKLIIQMPECDKNIPVIVEIPPGKSSTVTLRLLRPDKHSKISFRIGLNLIHHSKEKWLAPDQFTSPKNMIWSNEITIKRN